MCDDDNFHMAPCVLFWIANLRAEGGKEARKLPMLDTLIGLLSVCIYINSLIPSLLSTRSFS